MIPQNRLDDIKALLGGTKGGFRRAGKIMLSNQEKRIARQKNEYIRKAVITV